jgi:hypothetical protein
MELRMKSDNLFRVHLICVCLFVGFFVLFSSGKIKGQENKYQVPPYLHHCKMQDIYSDILYSTTSAVYSARTFTTAKVHGDVTGSSVLNSTKTYEYLLDATAIDQGAATIGANKTIKDLVDSIGKNKSATLVLTHSGSGNTTTYTLTTSAKIPSNIDLRIENGAVLDGSGTLIINGSFEAGLHQVFGSSISVSISGNSVKEIYPEWWGSNTTPGTTDMTAEIQAAIDAGGDNSVIYFSSQTYLISGTVDVDQGANVSLIGEGGSEITLSVADKDGFNITQDNVSVVNLTMEGQGAYVTSGSSGKSLIVSSGDHTTIRGCYLKEPEQRGIEITGDYAIIESNIIEGGKYFADGAAIGSDRQHYGILLANGADHAKIVKNNIFPNSEANTGACIQGISSAPYIQNAVIENNFIDSMWNHGIYIASENSIISQNRITKCGIKVKMRASGISTKGNVISNNVIDVNDASSPLKGDAGIVLVNPKWSSIVGNSIRRAQDAGISITSSDSPYVVSYNTITGNMIDNVIDGSGSDAVGIAVDSTEIAEFSHNTISNNTFSNIGSDTDGLQAAIQINITDNDNHIENIISENTIITVLEVGFYLTHLTESIVANNTIYNVGQGSADAAIYVDDLQRSQVRGNVTYNNRSTLAYGYREVNSDYNIIEDNVFYNPGRSMMRATGFGFNSSVRRNSSGDGNISVDSTAGTRTIGYADLNKSVHLRDPNGGSRIDKTDTAANINAQLLFNNGASFEITYVNTGAVGETITIVGGNGVTLNNNGGSGDLVIPAQCVAKLVFVRNSFTTVRVFGTVNKRGALFYVDGTETDQSAVCSGRR